MPYFVWPERRGRWCTGTSATVPPCSLTSVGRKRCIPLNSASARTAGARNALSEQPVSRIVSPLSRLRTALAMRLCTSFRGESRRSTRYPTTAAAPLVARASTSAGMSAGSFWPSASSVTITDPRAAWKPAANAAVCPAFAAKETMCSAGCARFSCFSVSSEPSVEPSLTATTSKRRPRSTSSISPISGARLSRSLYTGITSDSSTGSGMRQLGSVGVGLAHPGEEGIRLRVVAPQRAIDLRETDPDQHRLIGIERSAREHALVPRLLVGDRFRRAQVVGKEELGRVGVPGAQPVAQRGRFGRVALMRAVDLGEADADDDFAMPVERLREQALEAGGLCVDRVLRNRQCHVPGELVSDEPPQVGDGVDDRREKAVLPPHRAGESDERPVDGAARHPGPPGQQPRDQGDAADD